MNAIDVERGVLQMTTNYHLMKYWLFIMNILGFDLSYLFTDIRSMIMPFNKRYCWSILYWINQTIILSVINISALFTLISLMVELYNLFYDFDYDFEAIIEESFILILKVISVYVILSTHFKRAKWKTFFDKLFMDNDVNHLLKEKDQSNAQDSGQDSGLEGTQESDQESDQDIDKRFEEKILGSLTNKKNQENNKENDQNRDHESYLDNDQDFVLIWREDKLQCSDFESDWESNQENNDESEEENDQDSDQDSDQYSIEAIFMKNVEDCGQETPYENDQDNQQSHQENESLLGHCRKHDEKYLILPFVIPFFLSIILVIYNLIVGIYCESWRVMFDFYFLHEFILLTAMTAHICFRHNTKNELKVVLENIKKIGITSECRGRVCPSLLFDMEYNTQKYAYN